MDVEVLRALAHPVRLGIVRRLAAEPDICACDFTDEFTVSQPTISAHLKVLREAGLVRTRREGTTICYSLVPETLAGVATELQRLADAGGSPAGLVAMAPAGHT
ncbi:ArsR/SmtB family transcription factor [Microtetraspora malaysiensis]|uniref:ArsR/SmtB family transcription factor n=1 Tax=Microtetraspora malaysiensis TaxID=161358 RepID=UPI003D926135